jgi:ligand-binding sensor domain-containing protein/signal transduction histidine kinase
MRFASTAVALVLASSLVGQRLPIRPYTTEDGLTHNHINRIRSDSRGFLWICTDEGLSRFDGHSFTRYTVHDGLPHRWVNDLLESRDGTYWVATDGGVCRYDPQAKQHFRVYRPSAAPGAARINGLLEDRDGDIWCATYDGLYRMLRTRADEVRFIREEIGAPTHTYEGSLVNSVFLDRRNTLWAASRSGLYRRPKGGAWERYYDRDAFPDDFFEMVAEDRDGGLWAATRRRGLCSLVADVKPGGQAIRRCYSTADGLPSNDVRSVYQSSDKRLWIGTVGGLSEFLPGASTTHFRNYTTANGLSGSAVYALQEDRDGNLWIGTRENGLMKMADSGFETYEGPEGYRSGGFSSSIFESQAGELCAIAGDHSAVYLNVFDGVRFSAIRVNVPLGTDARQEAAMLEGRGGEWWVSTGEGLFRFAPVRRARDLSNSRPGAAFTVKQGLLENGVYPVYQDSKGNLWFAAWRAVAGANELYYWERATNSMRSVSTTGAPSLQHKSATAIAEDGSGQLWIGFKEGGLVRGRSSGFAEMGYGAEPIEALHFDRAGRLWISSPDSGVTRVDNPASAQPRFRSYNTAAGLSSNQVWCMTDDRFGRIYFGTGSGVDRLDPATGSIRHYTTSEGVVKGAIKAAYRDRSDALWFATSSGISRLVPVPELNSPPPVVLISALRVMGAPHPISDLGESRIAGVTLPSSRNGVEIEFLGFDFSPNTRHRYQYKLDGAGNDWSTPSEQRSVNFAKLAAGSYRFLVRAVNTDGVSSLRPATFEFTVRKPLWAEWWFLAAMAMAAAAVACGTYHHRVAQLMKLERVRARISADLHDGIGASLSQIAILSEVARAQLDDEAHPAVAGPLAEITSISRDVINSMSDMVWVINPRYEHLSDLAARVRRFAGETLGPRDIALRFHGPDAGQDPLLGEEFRRHFLLIAKEAVHNIARHSGATEARIELELHTRRLTLRVSDNGRGFDDVAGRQGNGLVNMRRRAVWLRGSAEVCTSPGKGAMVTVTAPL